MNTPSGAAPREHRPGWVPGKMPRPAPAAEAQLKSATGPGVTGSLAKAPLSPAGGSSTPQAPARAMTLQAAFGNAAVARAATGGAMSAPEARPSVPAAPVQSKAIVAPQGPPSQGTPDKIPNRERKPTGVPAAPTGRENGDAGAAGHGPGVTPATGAADTAKPASETQPKVASIAAKPDSHAQPTAGPVTTETDSAPAKTGPTGNGVAGGGRTATKAGAPGPDATTKKTPAEHLGGEPGGAIGEKREPATPPAQADKPGATSPQTPELIAFLAQSQALRIGVVAADRAAQAQITASAAQAKKGISQAVDVQVQRLQTDNQQSVQQVQRAHTQAKTAITSTANTKIEATRQAAEAEKNHLSRTIEDAKTSLGKAAQTRSSNATSTGEREAQRAVDGSQERAKRAQAIGADAAARYRAKGDSGDLPAKTQAEAARLAGEFTKTGAEVARIARRDAADLIVHIQEDADRAGAEYGRALDAGTGKIEKTREETIETIQKQQADVVEELDKKSAEVEQNLRDALKENIAALRSFAAGAQAAADDDAASATQKVTADTARATVDIDEFVARIGPAGWAGPEVLTAQADLTRAVTSQRAELDRFVATVNQRMASLPASAAQEGGKLGDALTALGRQAATEFEVKTAETSGKTITSITELTTKSTTEMQALAPEAQARFSQTESQLASDWDKKVDSLSEQLTGKVDKSLADEDTALTQLKMSLPTDYESEKEGWLSKVGHALSSFFETLWGVIVGFFERAWETLVAIWDFIKTPLFWIIVAIVAIVLIVAILWFGWAAVVAGLKVIAEILIVLGIIIGLLAAAYFIYLAITTPNISPYERGKLIGKGLFEVVLAFTGTSVAAKLTSWLSRVAIIARVLDKIGDITKAIRLIRLLRDINKLDRLLVLAGDAGKLLELLDKINNADKLLILLERVGNADKLLALIDHVHDAELLLELLKRVTDADKLLALLQKVSDGRKLLQLLKLVPDVDQLLSLVNKVHNSDQLIQLLGKVSDAGKLLQLLEKVPDTQKLLQLVNNITDTDSLLLLLDRITDVDKLIPLTDLVKDGRLLLQLLDEVPNTEKLKVLLELAQDPQALLRLLRRIADHLLLERLLGLADNAGQLDGMLTLLKDDAPLLLQFMDLAGVIRGNGNASRLLRLMQLAAAKASDAKRVQLLCQIAAGDAAKFTRLADLVPLFRQHSAAGIVEPAEVITSGYASADMPHFANRHTLEFFEFVEKNLRNGATMWPDGTSLADISAHLAEALRDLARRGRLPQPVVNPQELATAAGVQVKVGVRGAPGNVEVGQFFPMDPGFLTVAKSELRAIGRILSAGVL
jgi:hypothetical protein